MPDDPLNIDPLNPPTITIRKHGVVAVIVREGRHLVIRRSLLVRAPGMYCFPGGGIELGESPEHALVREMREELQVDVEPVRQVWHYVTSWGVDLVWWLARLPPDAELVANPLEVEDFFWMTPDEIRGLTKLLESNLQFLEAVQRGEVVLT